MGGRARHWIGGLQHRVCCRRLRSSLVKLTGFAAVVLSFLFDLKMHQATRIILRMAMPYFCPSGIILATTTITSSSS